MAKKNISRDVDVVVYFVFWTAFAGIFIALGKSNVLPELLAIGIAGLGLIGAAVTVQLRPLLSWKWFVERTSGHTAS